MPASRDLSLAAVSGLLLAVACAGCTGDDQGAGGSGGSSGASVDAGGAGGSGATGGSSTDGSADAAPDVAGDSYTEGWELAPWNPPGCQILRAVDLAKAVPPLVWKDCDNGVVGCQYLDTSMLEGTPNKNGDKLGPGFKVAKSSGKTFFSIAVIFALYQGGLVTYEVDAGPRAAWRSDSTTPCVLGRFNFGVESGSALTVSSTVTNEIASVVLYNKSDPTSPDQGSSFIIDKTLTQNSLAGVFGVEFSSTLMALEMGLDALLYVWDFGSGKPKLIPRPPDIAEDYRPIVQGNEMAFIRDSAITTARNFAVRHADGTIETLYKKSSVWAIDLHGDGVDYAWQELNETTNVLELWSSPFTMSPASFQPKKVRTIEDATTLVRAGFSGEGWWVYYKDDATLRAVRLSDGMWLDAAAPSGFGWVTPFGVVNGEIWSTIHVAPGSVATVYSIARVPIASLGTPKP